MKFFAAVALLAIFAVAFAAEKPIAPEKVEELSSAEAEDGPRDKRGLLLSYTAPIAPVAPVAPVAYTSYAAAPIAYSSSYSLPYAYRSYPYSYYSTYLG